MKKETKCKICDGDFNKNHLRIHNITTKEYYDTYFDVGECGICNNETSFYGMNIGYSRFCSNKCVGIYNNRRSLIELTCKICEKEYSIKKGNMNQKTCSKKCGNTSHSIKITKHKNINKKCKWCGNHFEIYSGGYNKKCCSISCSNKLRSDTIRNTPGKLEKMHEKYKKTMMERWGVDAPLKHPDIMDRYRHSKKLKFGSSDFTFPMYNKKSIIYFEWLNKYMGWNGIYATNPYEYNVPNTKFYVDYYEPNLNVVIEYDESHHYKFGNLRDGDRKRQEIIENELKCKFYRIKDSEIYGK